MGSTTLTAPGGLKEGDSTFRPVDLRPHKQSWPTLVVECGVSQSLRRLVADSRWWLDNSGAEVKIIILISVSETARSIHFEKWGMGNVPNQQATCESPNTFIGMPTKTHELDIAGDVVTGGPLGLEFEKTMLRQPRPGEGDIIFDTQELERFATYV
ncbi:hypothetical protein C7212DRAFT_200726 [Tuber magnatum]|uniref:Uncharacterized protein n=1 Tax=Tuber magnatum TaxID=42249 RepID=A0A317SLS2_9PEZI|nr:hypothetical protein C7212DRAFT_200726 [Tuber magnatum]